MADSWELEVDSEEYRVRKWREGQLKRAGVGDFAAFRLSMLFDVDLHRLVELAEKGAPDEFLVNEFID